MADVKALFKRAAKCDQQQEKSENNVHTAGIPYVTPALHYYGTLVVN